MVNFPSPYNKVLPEDIKLEKTPDYHTKDEICNRVKGSLIGLAIGDALGASVEFRPQQYLAANPVSKMEGGGTWGLDAGKWTDDTSMALCLASSLIEENGFNPYDQMVRYKWWHIHGYLSSTGNCFDIGQATRESIKEFSLRQKLLKIHYRCRNEHEVDTLASDSVQHVEGFSAYCGSLEAAGNGALMRLAPIPLFFFKTPILAIQNAGLSAALTHANKKAIDGCRYYAALIVGALHKFTKEQLLDKEFYSKNRKWFGEESLHDDIIQISRGSYQKDKKKGGYEQGIRGKGYIVHSLEAALWAFWYTNSFEEGALAAVNLGDDTDTTAAIYGQLAGAFYSYDSIPKDWLDKLYARDLILRMSEWIHFQGTQQDSKDHERHQASPIEKTKPTTTETNQSKIKHTLPKQNSTREESNLARNYNRSFSQDSNTNTRITSPSNVRMEPVPFSSFQTNNDLDDYTRKHDYQFYPANNSRNSYMD